MNTARALVVVGLGFGDEGKGTMVDYLVRKHQARAVVRFNGGHQAAHAVVLPDGRSHKFSQFGSGTLAGADTYLSEHVVIEPLAMQREAMHLEDSGVSEPFSLLSINEACWITTPYHRHANRLLEQARGDNRHGSCGLGVGETVEMAVAGKGLRVRDVMRAEPDS